jgi:prepilin-type N-terminal cleavage/methylation domain-containing protein
MSKHNGFTFVEILLTLLILSVSAVPMMQLFATAVEQSGTVDEFRDALDLVREEVEKVKNLALTEDQIKSLGNVVSPPIFLNRTVWYLVRVVDPDVSPLQVAVYAFRDSLATRPVVSVVTIISK